MGLADDVTAGAGQDVLVDVGFGSNAAGTLAHGSLPFDDDPAIAEQAAPGRCSCARPRAVSHGRLVL